MSGKYQTKRSIGRTADAARGSILTAVRRSGYRARSERRRGPHLRTGERRGQRTARVRQRHQSRGDEPRGGQRRRRAAGPHRPHQGGRHRQTYGPHRLDPGGRRNARPRHQPAGRDARRIRADRRRNDRNAARTQGPRRHLPPTGEPAAANRTQGDRRDDSDRPRTARTDHRRPPDRKNLDRDRHDPEPENELRRGQTGLLHLCGHRPEGLYGSRAGQHPAGERRHGLRSS